MKPHERIARETLLKALLRDIDALIETEPTDRELAIIALIKGMRDDAAARVMAERVDYLDRVQKAAHRAWIEAHANFENRTGPEFDGIAGVDTPLGRLKAITYRRPWKGGRIAWATEYYLDDQPVTIREIRAAGLAQRPTSRNRQRRKP